MESHDFERRRDELHAEWARLSGQKPFAWMLLVVGSALFVSNYLGVNEPTNNTLGALTLMAVIAGGVWLWMLRQKLNRNARRTRDNNQELDRRGEQ